MSTDMFGRITLVTKAWCSIHRSKNSHPYVSPMVNMLYRFATLSYADDHSRVMLSPIDGDPDSDYINANTIDVRCQI